MTHGTRSHYIHGCHCIDCCRANTDYLRMRRGLAPLVPDDSDRIDVVAEVLVP